MACKQKFKTLLLSAFYLIVMQNSSLNVFSQTINTADMNSIVFIPNDFHNVKFGLYESGENVCTPFYPNFEMKIKNEVVINIPQKIICNSEIDSLIIPICGAYIIGERRGLKYAHLSTPIIHIFKIDEETWYSGKIIDPNLKYEHPDLSFYNTKQEKNRMQKIKEAQSYSDDELNNETGSFSGSAINVNALDFVDLTIQPGIYEIYISMYGLESNQLQVEILLNNKK